MSIGSLSHSLKNLQQLQCFWIASLRDSTEWFRLLIVSSLPHSHRAAPAQRPLPPPHTPRYGQAQWNCDDERGTLLQECILMVKGTMRLIRIDPWGGLQIITAETCLASNAHSLSLGLRLTMFPSFCWSAQWYSCFTYLPLTPDLCRAL